MALALSSEAGGAVLEVLGRFFTMEREVSVSNPLHCSRVSCILSVSQMHARIYTLYLYRGRMGNTNWLVIHREAV